MVDHGTPQQGPAMADLDPLSPPSAPKPTTDSSGSSTVCGPIPLQALLWGLGESVDKGAWVSGRASAFEAGVEGAGVVVEVRETTAYDDSRQ